MKIIHNQPPNIDLIRAALNPNAEAIFCYGDTIYNPSKRELTEDIIKHEEVHQRQQGDTPDLWYTRYLTDTAFRLEQEIAAYGEQYKYAKEKIEEAASKASQEGNVLAAGKTKLLKYALENMAQALSGKEYGNLVNYGEAESKIRRYAKD